MGVVVWEVGQYASQTDRIDRCDRENSPVVPMNGLADNLESADFVTFGSCSYWPDVSGDSSGVIVLMGESGDTSTGISVDGRVSS